MPRCVESLAFFRQQGGPVQHYRQRGLQPPRNPNAFDAEAARGQRIILLILWLTGNLGSGPMMR